ncbi:hypothetical protein Tco_1260254, partial [Tanacetum coccineum]
MVLPFLCSDDSESDTEIPERHVSPTPHDVMLTRWRSRVASRSSSPTTSTPEIPTALILPAPYAMEDIPIGRLYHTHPGGPCRTLTTRKSVRPLPSHRLALRTLRYRRSISIGEDSAEEDIDTDVLEDIEADATAIEVVVDSDVEARIDAGIGIEVNVGVDVEDEVEDEVESSDVCEIFDMWGIDFMGPFP